MAGEYIPQGPILTAGEFFEKSSKEQHSPVNLSLDVLKEVQVPTLEWGNFSVLPKLMKISNSGMTAVLSGKWLGPRPYLTKGPLPGRYVFAQLHFHWGRTFQEGSEHRVNGQPLPLEAHVMFFKNTYESQNDAMKKRDGTVTLAYFFEIQDEDNPKMEPIMKVLPKIKKSCTSHNMSPVPLQQFAPKFSKDYFMYWGNVHKMHVLWLICRKPIGISQNQLSFFKTLLDPQNTPINKNFRDPLEQKNRVVFHANPSSKISEVLLPIEVKELQTEKIDDMTPKKISDGNSGIGDILDNKIPLGDIFNFNHLKSPNMAEFKYTLARTLLEIEKKEGSDYGMLENYIKSKFAKQQKKLDAQSENEFNSFLDDRIQDENSHAYFTNLCAGKKQNESNTENKLDAIDEVYTNAGEVGERQVKFNRYDVREESDSEIMGKSAKSSDAFSINACNPGNIEMSNQILKDPTESSRPSTELNKFDVDYLESHKWNLKPRIDTSPARSSENCSVKRSVKSKSPSVRSRASNAESEEESARSRTSDVEGSFKSNESSVKSGRQSVKSAESSVRKSGMPNASEPKTATTMALKSETSSARSDASSARNSMSNAKSIEDLSFHNTMEGLMKPPNSAPSYTSNTSADIEARYRRKLSTFEEQVKKRMEQRKLELTRKATPTGRIPLLKKCENGPSAPAPSEKVEEEKSWAKPVSKFSIKQDSTDSTLNKPNQAHPNDKVDKDKKEEMRQRIEENIKQLRDEWMKKKKKNSTCHVWKP